jgi:hypothetical protein
MQLALFDVAEVLYSGFSYSTVLDLLAVTNEPEFKILNSNYLF